MLQQGYRISYPGEAEMIQQGDTVWMVVKDTVRQGVIEANVNFDGLYPVIEVGTGRRRLRYKEEMFGTKEDAERNLNHAETEDVQTHTGKRKRKTAQL